MQTQSLPSRGAWIEIWSVNARCPEAVVAPLTGSVDRNSNSLTIQPIYCLVAPLTGSVDRNEPSHITYNLPVAGRSPHGERG